MKKVAAKTIYLSDYCPPDFLILKTELHFDLGDSATRVKSRLSMRRHPRAQVKGSPLVLDGEDLELVSLSLDGKLLPPDAYHLDEISLSVAEVPDEFILEVETRINPAANTRLEGLYLSSGNFCTQCEAESFRRITYFLDRPDIMSIFTVTLVADTDCYPVLLANGNPVAQGAVGDNRHFATWNDPYPKPAYLFALVAGKLNFIEDTHTTASGRSVQLRIYVEPHNIDKCTHAMASLKKAMRFDEERFGLEYDLDLYMIVAVDDFNMGAMENKGLNIFNSKYVLARPDIATDEDYINIESVIAHEYFHNWTGNRVTCRDWFQLSLKEGLTVFRDQSFTAETTLGALKRIQDVRLLRTHQFAEDASPMAHPICPASYMEVNNFYTLTVYEKGAEVVRMYETLLGREGFRRGLDLYFQRHDGQAVTTEDFLQAMSDANGENLRQFQRWYDRAGTPEVIVRDEWDEANGRYTLILCQIDSSTPGQAEKQPFLMPFAVSLLDQHGQEMPCKLSGDDHPASSMRVLHLQDAEQRFEFEGLSARPLPSLNRNFSAPIKVIYPYTDQQLAFLAAEDSDPFNRWDAGQQLYQRLLRVEITSAWTENPRAIPQGLFKAFQGVLDDDSLSPSIKTECLILPNESLLAEDMMPTDPDAIHNTRERMRLALAHHFNPRWHEIYVRYGISAPYRFNAEAAGNRRLRNLALAYLALIEDDDAQKLCWRQFKSADNMTESLGALSALIQIGGEQRAEALQEFYAHWHNEPLVLDKWFALQAGIQESGTLDRVRDLIRHPAFSIHNPNRVRALIYTFALRNPTGFHALDGSGYRFVADQVLAIDPDNPQVAARLVKVFTHWRDYGLHRQNMMRTELERMLSVSLSRDVYEIVSKSLEN